MLSKIIDLAYLLEPTIFNSLFFEIPFEIYSPYVLWLYVILLFVALLPSLKTVL